MKSKIFYPATVIIMIGILHFQKKPWPVPDAARTKKNPVALNAASTTAGKSLWGTHCKSCHGTKGLGDGPKAAQLKTEAGDFSKADVQGQTDGSLFYKIGEGRDDMPSFKKKITDPEDIWNLVNYIRTLKVGGATTPPVVIKDTAKKVEKPVVIVKKDTVVKKENPVTPKKENISVQDQINALKLRIDSIVTQLILLNEKVTALRKDTAVIK